MQHWVFGVTAMLAIGCAEGTSEDGGGDGASGGPMLATDGKRWCAQIVGAFGFDQTLEDHVEIEDGTPPAPPVYCDCVGPIVDDRLEEIIVMDPGDWDLDGDNDDDIDVFVIGSNTHVALGEEVGTFIMNGPDVLVARNKLVADPLPGKGALHDCEDMRDALGLIDTQSPVTHPGCDEIADTTDEPDSRDPGPDVLSIYKENDNPCTLTEMMVIDTGGYDSKYTLSSVIVLEGGVYEIDEDFFEDMIANPAWFLGDSARIIPTGSGGYEIDSVTSGEIADALGLQEGDIFVSINERELDTAEDVADAFLALRDETEFDLVVKRSGDNMTLSYEKVSN